jgi:hypothetical protein
MAGSAHCGFGLSPSASIRFLVPKHSWFCSFHSLTYRILYCLFCFSIPLFQLNIKATMHFSCATILLSILALSTAAPAGSKAKRASVLTAQSYADFQVSDGVAGNALAEVNAKFPVSVAKQSRCRDANSP